MRGLARPRLRSWRAFSTRLTLTLAGGLALGLSLSCADELPRGRSCGDGWWDAQFEACDPSSPERGYVDLCRDRGEDVDAFCTAQCEIECTRCGDGVASGDEVCDGDDLRGATCPSGAKTLRCTDTCDLDESSCPPSCGDDIVNGGEECEPTLTCTTDENCGPDLHCHPDLLLCIPSAGFGTDLSCSNYETTAVGLPEAKPYAAGLVQGCTPYCSFGRNRCSFCGDGELDGAYMDFVAPDGTASPKPAEVCDGDQARLDVLLGFCGSRCVDEPVNGDVEILCDFSCNETCSGFATDEIAPAVDGCCLAKGSPCPTFDSEGVPDLPCCSWLSNPEWLADEVCVPAQTGNIPVTMVCP